MNEVPVHFAAYNNRLKRFFFFFRAVRFLLLGASLFLSIDVSSFHTSPFPLIEHP